MGNLTWYVCAASVSSYGIQDYYIDNNDIKLELYEENMLTDTQIKINGKIEVNEFDMNKRQKTKLEAEMAFLNAIPKKPFSGSKYFKWVKKKPFKWVTSDGWYLSIDFDINAGHMTMKCQGVDAEKLPLAKQDEHIFRNKIVDIDTPEQRLV